MEEDPVDDSESTDIIDVDKEEQEIHEYIEFIRNDYTDAIMGLSKQEKKYESLVNEGKEKESIEFYEKNIVSASQNMIDVATEYEVESESLKEIHSTLIKVLEKSHKGIELAAQSMKEESDELAEHAIEVNNEYNQLFSEYQGKLKKILDKYDIQANL